jgi:hypothetical protein
VNDVLDIIKNIQTLSVDNSAFQILKDFERVLDELDIYVYENWEDGELMSGPNISRYTVNCKFMWQKKHMPNPEGGKILADYGCQVLYKKDFILIPRKVRGPEDFRPGTKKGKIDAHPVWLVSISMPKKLMQNIYQGYNERDNYKLAGMMKYETQGMQPQQVATEPGLEAQNNAPPASPPAF